MAGVHPTMFSNRGHLRWQRRLLRLAAIFRCIAFPGRACRVSRSTRAPGRLDAARPSASVGVMETVL